MRCPACLYPLPGFAANFFVPEEGPRRGGAGYALYEGYVPRQRDSMAYAFAAVQGHVVLRAESTGEARIFLPEGQACEGAYRTSARRAVFSCMVERRGPVEACARSLHAGRPQS